MIINGYQCKLKVQRANVHGEYVWGVREAVRNGCWVNDTANGWTTNLDFHGRIFATREEAQAYVDGYNTARREMKDFILEKGE